MEKSSKIILWQNNIHFSSIKRSLQEPCNISFVSERKLLIKQLNYLIIDCIFFLTPVVKTPGVTRWLGRKSVVSHLIAWVNTSLISFKLMLYCFLSPIFTEPESECLKQGKQIEKKNEIMKVEVNIFTCMLFRIFTCFAWYLLAKLQ